MREDPTATVVVRGEGYGGVPFDDYSDVVTASCHDERETTASGPGSDNWIAVWYQHIYHRPDHHDVDPHVSPSFVELDVRESPIVEVQRCLQGRVTR